MFVCDCPTCGRRELRGPRSLHPFPVDDGVAWVTQCRGCGEPVTIVASRPRRGSAVEPVVPIPTKPRAA